MAKTDAEKAAAKAAKDAEKAAAKAASKDSVSVSWNGGTREFSREVHGEEFADLADQFAAKHGGKVA